MTTQTGSTLWLLLAGGNRHVVEVISKVETFRNQSSVVLSKHNGEVKKTAWALCTVVVARDDVCS